MNNGKQIKGRLDGTIPRDGELNPNIVARALGLEDTRGKDIPSLLLHVRLHSVRVVRIFTVTMH
jgi:hypothetical protein